uniref:FIST C-domain domain-containing protein n=1 Tax=Amphora coffeiformis TaxID=265554 RepID=A0A7S3P6C6_9STRA
MMMMMTRSSGNFTFFLLLNLLPWVACFLPCTTTTRLLGASKLPKLCSRLPTLRSQQPPRLAAESSSTKNGGGSQTQESRWENLVSTESDTTEALTEIFENLRDDSQIPDLAFLFVSQFHSSKFESIVKQASQQLSPACQMLSVVGSGVIGENLELDEPSKPSISILLGYHLPEDSIEVFDFNTLHKPPPEVGSDYWGHLASKDASYLIFGDPWSPVENVTAALGTSAVVAGGISVPAGVGATVARNNKPLSQGSLVGVRFQNAMKLQVVTAQGCRPIHDTPFTITAAEGSCILELDSEPALKVMETVVNGAGGPLPGVVCGIQMAADQNDGKKEDVADTVHSDDYLIRQIVGFLPTKAGIVVAGRVQTGERLRFHVRDKNAAEHDLELMLQRARTERTVFGGKGKLVCAFQISCVARGQTFFGEKNVDLGRVKSLLGSDGPVAGFYAGGEIGPVGLAGFTEGSNSGSHIHGFTTVVAYLCDTNSLAANDNEPQTVLSPIADDPTAWG